MALLIAPGVRVIDDDGTLISGGKVRVYDANTTDYSDLFSDEAMTVPLPNPVIANPAGWPSSDGSTPTLIFTATGTYDVAFLDAADSVLATFSDVSTFGEEGGELSRTVSGAGRFLVTGSAGAVMIQVGDPSPDDTGGTLTLEGWAGTQADTITLDAAAVNAGTSAGALKENSKRLVGVVATASTALSAATSLVIPLANEPSGVRAWRVDVFDLYRSAATAVTLTLQFSFDGGATYLSTNEYKYGIIYRSQGSAALVEGGADAAASIQIAQNSNGNTNIPMWGMLEIITASAAGSSDATVVRGEFIGVNQEATPRVTRSISAGYCQSASQGMCTHIKIIASTGNINGNYRVTPLRGFGET